MGEAIIGAASAIIVMAFAVMLIVRGRRAGRRESAAQQAPWKVGTEPDGKGVVVFLYRQVGGAHRDSRTYGRVERSVPDYQEVLLDLVSNAELEASMLNNNR